MSDLYTDAEHFAAAEAILANFHAPDEKHGSWWINPGVSATAVLDAVAPAIAARALREAARDVVDHVLCATCADELDWRADEIERTP